MKSKTMTMTLEQFADLINSSDEWKLEFDDIIVANDWTAIQDEWHVCHDGKQMIYFDDNGQAKIAPIEEVEIAQIDKDFKLFAMIEEVEIAQIDKDFKLFQMIEELENSVKERKLTPRAAEIKLLEKYEIDELEDVLPHRKVIATDFDNKNLYLENGECVTGEFPRKGKIYDNVEYCQDTKRFEFLEYFIKDEEEE